MSDVTAEDQRRRSVLFNDITHATTDSWLPLSDRLTIMEHLWAQGWRRDVRPEDVTERPPLVEGERCPDCQWVDLRRLCDPEPQLVLGKPCEVHTP